MFRRDSTKEVLEQVLAGLYSDQALGEPRPNDSYLLAQDGQYLGRITANRYDNYSILNEYGPYGSKYSTTSIFNAYSEYGSKYGRFSLNNPYCNTPPKLFISGMSKGVITTNRYLANGISTGAFLYALRRNLEALLSGDIARTESEARRLGGESYIEGSDGNFLGSLVPDRFNDDSIFNAYGSFGSKYSQTSIFNPYSEYGSRFSNLSAYNELATAPPSIYVNGRFIDYLTKNTYLSPRIDPDNILDWVSKNVSRWASV